MRIVRAADLNLRRGDNGEAVAILTGRHKKHGASKTHTVALVELEVGASSVPHFHSEREESYFFLEGCGIAEVAGEVVEVGPYDLIHSLPGERHQFRNIGEKVLRYLVITAPVWIPEDSHL